MRCSFRAFLSAVLGLALAGSAGALRLSASSPNTRREAVQRTLQGAVALPFLLTGGAATGFAGARPALAVEEKQRGLSAERMKEIVRGDLVDRQFLATADFTRSIYDEAAIFTDEIDSYSLPKFVEGTQKLFVKEKSHVDLVGDVEATDSLITFRFDEVLCFNIPFQPKVRVSGKVELRRGADGLIESYREFWDQTPLETVLKARFD